MTQASNSYIGSDLDDFLKQEDLYTDVNAGAAKKLLDLQSLLGLDGKQHHQNGFVKLIDKLFVKIDTSPRLKPWA